MTAIYAQPSDVRRIMQNQFKFTTSTNVTEEDVTDSIDEAQDEIDQLTQHAWREKTVTNEFYDFPSDYPRTYYPWDPGIAIHLRHREIRTPGTANGDKIEIWEGGTAYVDWLATKTQNRNEDFWVEEEQGILYLKFFYPFFREKSIRLTYRYGGSVVPKDIQKATAAMAAIDLVQSDDKSALLAETGDPTRLSHLDRINRMQRKIDRILRNRTEIIVI